MQFLFISYLIHKFFHHYVDLFCQEHSAFSPSWRMEYYKMKHNFGYAATENTCNYSICRPCILHEGMLCKR